MASATRMMLSTADSCPNPVLGGTIVHGGLHAFINSQRAYWRDVDPIENLICSQIAMIIGGGV